MDPVDAIASRGHILLAGFGVILLTAVAMILVLSAQGVMPQFGHVSLGSVVLVALYVVGHHVGNGGGINTGDNFCIVVQG
jgi:hypothetical protein